MLKTRGKPRVFFLCVSLHSSILSAVFLLSALFHRELDRRFELYSYLEIATLGVLVIKI